MADEVGTLLARYLGYNQAVFLGDMKDDMRSDGGGI